MSLKVGIQLFSVRDDMWKDPAGTLRAIKEAGYDGVESCGFCGMTPDYFKGICDGLGLEIISSHNWIDAFLDKYDKTIDNVLSLGVKYIAIPYLGENSLPGGEDYLKCLENINTAGNRLKEHGVKLLYHNHRHEFGLINGDYTLDTFFNSVPEDIFAAEIDVAWVSHEKLNPADFIRRYKGRVPVVHCKDFDDYNEETGEHDAFNICPVGEGVQNFKAICEAAEEAGSEWLIVEQDVLEYKGKNALECAAISRNNLKKLGY